MSKSDKIQQQKQKIAAYRATIMLPKQASSVLPFSSVVCMKTENTDYIDKNSKAVESLLVEIQYVLLLLNSSEKLIEYLKTKFKETEVYIQDLLKFNFFVNFYLKIEFYSIYIGL